jgi:hypothetical protein
VDPEPSPSPSPPVTPAAAATLSTADPERYGPLELQRHVKPDGRALLVYRWVGEPVPQA